MAHPMTAFMAGGLSPETIYDRLVEDLAKNGSNPHLIHPDTTFYDQPPTGLGYSGALAMQAFINTYVNGNKGRYNLAPTTNIFVTQVPSPKCVGNLAALIYAKQQ